MPRPVAVRVAPERAAQAASAPEEVSLGSLGAIEAGPAAEPVREKVQSADMDDLEIVEIATEIVEIGTEQATSSASNFREALDEPVPESAPRPAAQSVEVELEP